MADKIAYAWALHLTGDTPKAEETFKKRDNKFANFPARLEYTQFLIETNRSDAAKNVLKAIIDEHEGMDSYERNLKKQGARAAKRLLESIK